MCINAYPFTSIYSFVILGSHPITNEDT